MIELYVSLGLALTFVLSLAVVGLKGCAWFVDWHREPARTVTRNTPPSV